MKFVITTDYRYWWPVKVRLPNPDQRRSGQFVEQEFKALFRAMPTDEARQVQDEIAKLPAEERVQGQNDLLRRVVLNWDDSVVDQDGDTVDFSAGQLDQLLTNVWVLAAFWRAWTNALTGDSARLGN